MKFIVVFKFTHPLYDRQAGKPPKGVGLSEEIEIRHFIFHII